MKDMLGRDLAVGDFVVFYANLYQVVSVDAKVISGRGGHGYAKIMIHPASKTSKPVQKYSREMVQVPAADVTLHLLKNGSVL
jgi:translation elongation factor P/translation initiation factor 5A